MTNSHETAFDSAIRALEAEIGNLGAHVTTDAAARQAYVREIRALSDELRQRATSGQITWAQAAAEAQEVRNATMQAIRGRSTPVGRALAERLKREGRTLNELVGRKTVQAFGPNASFERLAPAQKNRVFADIVKSAGTSNPSVTSRARLASRAGRSLLVLSVALSVYSIATADDKLHAAGREALVTGAGIGGGVAGGALAGLACGPGAPVCVTAGAFIGGALAAFGADLSWNEPASFPSRCR